MNYIKFNIDGLVKIWSKFEFPCHISIENVPDGFLENKDYYSIDIQNNEIAGIKLRKDLEEHKTLEAEYAEEIKIKNLSNFKL